MTITRWPLQYSDTMSWYLPLETGKDIAIAQNMVSTGNQISVDVSSYPAIDINAPNLFGVTTNIQTQLNGKEPTITAGVSGQYWRGDKSWQTLNTAAVPELTNLYYTDTRARASLSSTASALTYTASTGVFSLTSGYIAPTTTDASNWNSAYTSRVSLWTSPLRFISNTASILRASTTVSGYLHSSDFGTFLNAAKDRSVFYPVTATSTYRTYRPTIEVNRDGECMMYYYIPEDFGALVSAHIILYVGLGSAEPEANFDIRNQYTFREGEIYNTYSNSDVVVADLRPYEDCRYHLDVTRIFEPLKPRTEGGIRIRQSHIAASIFYMGINFIYKI